VGEGEGRKGRGGKRKRRVGEGSVAPQLGSLDPPMDGLCRVTYTTSLIIAMLLITITTTTTTTTTTTRKRGKEQRDGRPPLFYRRRTFDATCENFVTVSTGDPAV